MQALQRRALRRTVGIHIPLRAGAAALAALHFGWLTTAGAQAPASPRPPAARAEFVLLGDLYAQVERSNPRVAVAKSLTQAALARVPGATRPPDPQVQLGFMNYMVPDLAPMATLGMRQLQVMQMLPLGGKLALSGRVVGAKAAAVMVRWV